VPATLTARLRREPPLIHGDGDTYFGLHWSALAWLERNVAPGSSTLETGCGLSTVVFAARGASHVAVQPDAGQVERIRRYCRAEGIDDSRLAFIAESSHTALLSTWQPTPLDVVLIDGAHAFPFPALDWFYTQAHVKVGGHVLVDDAHLRSVGALVRYLDQSPSWARVEVLGHRTPLYRKVDDAPPPFEHFGTAYDRRPSFWFLPPRERFVAWGANLLLERTPLQPLMRRHYGRSGRRL
jgi:hypothetical protein